MAKRFRARPKPRQIIDRAEREASFERALDRNRDWLAANFAGERLPEAPRRPKIETAADLESLRNLAMYERFIASDEHNETPDPLGKTGNYEPESVYSPAPPSRFQFERPRARRAGERNERDCELPPDPRRRETITVEDGSGRARGVISINPYSKRLTIGGFGLVERKRT